MSILNAIHCKLLCGFLSTLFLFSSFQLKAVDKPLTIAVASNFYLPLSRLLDETEHNFSVRLVNGSSGTLYAQIINGAPFDLFFSADEERPALLFENGHVEQPHIYVYGNLVLYPVYNSPDSRYTAQILTKAKRIALPNPELAPYGLAAQSVMTKLDIKGETIIKANNVAQTFQFADTGNVDIAFTAESLLLHAFITTSDKKFLSYHRVPQDLYSPIAQSAAVLRASKQIEEANRFLCFVLSQASQTKLQSFGYSLRN